MSAIDYFDRGVLLHGERETAVIGIPDEKWGEMVMGVVVRKEGCDIDETELLAYCKEGLGSVKAPKKIEFRTHLPKTAAGKVSRKEIRRPYWSGRERSV